MKQQRKKGAFNTHLKSKHMIENYIKTHPTLKVGKQSKSKISWYQKALKPVLPQNTQANILEIGPGLGEGIGHLKNILGYENCEAIDIDKEVAELCMETYGINVEIVECTTKFLEAKREHYDLIIMYHVIEHLPKKQVKETLAAIRDALRMDGKLLIVTPNVLSPIIGIDQYHIDFTHETPFSEFSLQQVLNSANYSKVELLNFWPPIDSLKRIIQLTFQALLLNTMRLYLLPFGAKRKIITHQLLCYATK